MTDEYKTGYGQPPKKSRFRKGQSGNPKGRPKKTKHTAIDVAAILDEPITVRKAGVACKMSPVEISIRQLVKRALDKKDLRAIREFLKLCKIHGVVVPTPPAEAGHGVLTAPTAADYDAWQKEYFEYILQRPPGKL